MKRARLIGIITCISLLFIGTRLILNKVQGKEPRVSWWSFQSIDTMKYSRDPSREKLHDPSFDATIEKQVSDIAAVGATHVAIATPYDDEFVPMLTRWIAAARKNNLNVWFRGNWSGWEKWFDYPKITREEHIQKTKAFIHANGALFADGDIFSACPECENGGPGDPRANGDATGHRKFLIDEYNVTKEAFSSIGKRVASNYHSMNGDVARLIMDKETTKALDGLVVIDHYVASPDVLVADIRAYALQSGGKVVLGEFGAPIPDIHGPMDENAQAAYLSQAFDKLALAPDLVGVNYWTNVGGSTKLWNDDGTKRKAVDTIDRIFRPNSISGTVKNEIGQPIKNATLQTRYKTVQTDTQGTFVMPIIEESTSIGVSAQGYENLSRTISANEPRKNIVLRKLHETPMFAFAKFVRKLLFFLP